MINKLKLARMEKGLSQLELGQKVKVSEKIISNFETGRSVPEKFMVARLAKALEKEPNEIWS